VARRARQISAALFAATLVAVSVSSSDTKSAPNAQLPGWRKESCRDVISASRFARAIARARPLVTRMKAAFGAPGLQVAVALDGKVVWSRVCGFADVRNRRPTTATTLFRVGSVSKVFTAAALARLVQAGKVDLDSEVQDYVPSFPRKSWPIRIRHLASHQSGIRHYAGSEALSTVHYDSVLESLSVFADDPLLFRPGSDYSYSSYGFNLLGAALERAAGTDYAGVLREQVLAPLGLSRTQNDRGGLRARAAFYEVREDRSAGPAPRVDLSNRYPSGGLISTAEEVARLASELGDPGFLTRATQATFFTETRPTNGRPTGHGLGLEVADSSFGRFVRHIGNVVGGTAFVLAHPRSRVAIAMTTNVGWVTVRTPPSLGRSVPDPPQLVVPFIAAARKR
jgi:serine beta-lactamase-like protein LACTB, mitochondrial